MALYFDMRCRDGREAVRISSLASLLAFAALFGCDGDMPRVDDAGVFVPARVTPRFEPSDGPMAFGAIAWPDDLYLDADGHPELSSLPSEEMALPAEFPDAMRATLSDLDGFSVGAPVFFYLQGEIDPASLPQSPSASTREDSSVFLLDVDPASPTAFRRVPVSVSWNAGLRQLAMRPWDGHPLTPGRRYAAVLTDSVLDDLGDPIGPAPRFAAIRDAAMRPEGADAAAYDHYTPVLSSLASNGIPRARVAGLAAFTVQTVAPDMRDARATVWARSPALTIDEMVAAGPALDALLGEPVEDAPGLDVEGGVVHRRIGWLVQGSMSSPWLLSDDPQVHGRFRRDGEGRLIVERDVEVPFTLTIPAGEVERLRLVIYQHGLGSERSTVMGIADALAGAGFAVLAIDIPFHGSRATGAGDVNHNYGPTPGPDGFGDRTGQEIQLDFLGVVDEAGELPGFHPAYPRDIFRQSVVDLMTSVHAVREGDWSALAASPGLETFGFADAPIGFVGVSLGGILGTVFVAHEPEIGAAVLNVTGGDLIRLVERSGSFSELFLSILFTKVGLDARALDPLGYPASFHPEIAVVQMLLDRGDAIAHAPLLATQPKHLLFQLAREDETVPNSATEALARATGAAIVGADPVHTDLERAEAPLRDNVEVDGIRVTRGLTVFAPATHGLLTQRTSSARFEAPVEPPFRPTAPRPVTNPVDAAVGQLVHFFESWRSGSAEIEAAP